MTAPAQAFDLGPGRDGGRQPVDGAICLFTTVGQIDDHGQDNRALLATVQPMLKPGAGLVVEVPQRAPAAAALVQSDVFERDDGRTEITRRFDRSTGIVSERFLVVDRGVESEFNLAYRLFTAEELSAMLSDAGFATVTLAESVAAMAAGETLSETSQTMVAFATTP